MTLELMKVEEGLGAGAVLYHKYGTLLSLLWAVYVFVGDSPQSDSHMFGFVALAVQKTETELQALDARKAEIQQAREARRRKQEENVQRTLSSSPLRPCAAGDM